QAVAPLAQQSARLCGGDAAADGVVSVDGVVGGFAFRKGQVGGVVGQCAGHQHRAGQDQPAQKVRLLHAVLGAQKYGVQGGGGAERRQQHGGASIPIGPFADPVQQAQQPDPAVCPQLAGVPVAIPQQ